MVDTAHSDHSSLRERVIEHMFLGELMRTLWCQGRRDIEVLRAEVDDAGYDVVVGCNGVMRFIQLKASHALAKTARVNINRHLEKKHGGCVIWIWFNNETMDLERLLWLGGRPGEAMPELGDKIARHTKGDQHGTKAERPNIRVINKGRFSTFNSMDEIVQQLFG